jgi:hypothetical protein
VRWLQANERPALVESDHNEDRRTPDGMNRRQASQLQRLRKGFWMTCSNASDVEKFDENFDLSTSHRMKVMDVLMDEVDKYQYIDDNRKRCKVTRK